MTYTWRRPHALDFGALIPHGAVRAYVMGDRGAKNEKATAEDIDTAMRLGSGWPMGPLELSDLRLGRWLLGQDREPWIHGFSCLAGRIHDHQTQEKRGFQVGASH